MTKNKEQDIYIPQIDNLTYPCEPHDSLLIPKIIDTETKFDASYPYYDKSFKAKFKRGFFYLIADTIGYLLNKKKYRIKIVGKENIKKNKKYFKKGLITVSNHVFRWDFLTIMNAFRFKHFFLPVKKEQVLTKDKVFIRNVGGIPIPDNISGLVKFYKAFDEINSKGIYIHYFPEASRWDYYQPIRPFKIGAFKMAYKYDVPVLPMAFSYRENKKDKNKPFITLNIGKPIFIDKGLEKDEAIEKLRQDTFNSVISLAHIKENKWKVDD